MAHSLIEVDAFSGPVVVPDNSDRATAASVERPVQALANRTKNLNRRLGDAEAAIDVSETNIAGLEGRVTTAEADIDSLEGRVTAAEARTLQDVFDASLEMVGDTPTATINVPWDHALVVEGEGSREFRSGRQYFSSLKLVPFEPGGLALHVDEGGHARFDGATDGSFSIGAPLVSTPHGATTPPAPNTASKAALVRAAGTGTQASEWMPMDWGDTDGGGSGWDATVTHQGGGLSGTTVTYGSWSKIGNRVSFDLRGETTHQGTITLGNFRVKLPSPAPDNKLAGVANIGATLSGPSLAAAGFLSASGASSGAAQPDVSVMVTANEGTAPGARAWQISGSYPTT